jgi:hypothetical protein
MPTIDPTLPALHEEGERLAQQVDLWFRQARSNLKAPSDRSCRMVAGLLMAIRYNRGDDENPGSTGRLAYKYGKLFLRHLRLQRPRFGAMETLAAPDPGLGEWFQEYQKEVLSRIDETREHIEALLPVLSPRRYAIWDPPRDLRLAAQKAWADANDGRYPRSTNPKHPLCRFLAPALAEIGLAISPAEIGEILRDRRRKPKDGQNR